MKFKILKNAGCKVMQVAGRKGLVLRKFSPEILLGIGIVGVVGTIVWASYQSTKLGETLEECDENMRRACEPPDEWIDAEDGEYEPDRREVAKAYGANVWSLVRLYAGPAALGVVSIGCIVGSHHILHARNLALGAAYAEVDELFKEYRERVVEDQGEEKDLQYRYGWKEETVEREVEGKNGKTKIVEETVRTPDYKLDEKTKFFDESCQPFWKNDPEKNLLFLKTQQNWANDKLRMTGSLFQNEVQDMIGLPRSGVGATDGWLWDDEHKDEVDFGLVDRYTGLPESDWLNRDFINGHNPVAVIRFNSRPDIYKDI